MNDITFKQKDYIYYLLSCLGIKISSEIWYNVVTMSVDQADDYIQQLKRNFLEI